MIFAIKKHSECSVFIFTSGSSTYKQQLARQTWSVCKPMYTFPASSSNMVDAIY